MRGRTLAAASQAAAWDCEHSSEKRRSGVEIIMECGGCREVPGLGNPRCFRSVLAALQQEGAPVAITMKSHIERRYGPAAAGTMGRMSELLGNMESLRAQLARDSGRGEQCPECVRPLAGKLAMAGDKLRAMNLEAAVTMAGSLEATEIGSSRGMCLDCAGITKVQVADIVKGLRDLGRQVVQASFAGEAGNGD